MTLYGPETFGDDCARRLEMIAPHLAVAVASVVSARTGMHPSTFVHAAPTSVKQGGSQLAGVPA